MCKERTIDDTSIEDQKERTINKNEILSNPLKTPLDK